MTFPKVLLFSVSSALMSLPMTVGLSLMAEPAMAQKGGNGNGNGNSNRERARGNGNGNSSDRAVERGNNGRGAIARELRGLNAAHANQRALESASPDSMPGKLYLYQQAVLAVNSKEDAVTEASDLLAALQAMTEEQFLELNPTLDYGSTLLQAGQAYQSALNELDLANVDVEGSLLALTDGRQLSEEAMDELAGLLGL